MAARTSRIVVDASIVLAWILPDEAVVSSVNQLFTRHTFTSPALLYYEVLNGLRSAVIQKRLSQSLLAQAESQFLSLPIKLVNPPELHQHATSLAIKLNLSVYDAAYVALAKNTKIPLFTLDQRLLRQASPEITIRTP